MRRTKEIIANCIMAIEDEGEFVAITFGLQRSHGPHEVATVMMTPSARDALAHKLTLGVGRHMQ